MDTTKRNPNPVCVHCDTEGAYCCRTHSVSAQIVCICERCRGVFHFECEVAVRKSSEEAKKDLEFMKGMVQRLEWDMDKSRIGSYDQQVAKAFNEFAERIKEVERRMEEASQWHEIDELETQLREIQVDLSKSKEVKEILFLSASREVSLQGSFNENKEHFSESIEINPSSESQNNLNHQIEGVKNERKEEIKDCTSLSTRKPIRDEAENLSVKRLLTFLKENYISKSFNLSVGLSVVVLLLLLWNSNLRNENNDLKEAQIKIAELAGYYPQDSDLTLDMTEKHAQNLVKTMNTINYKFGEKTRLSINKIDVVDENIKEFITNFSSPSLRIFSLNSVPFSNDHQSLIKIKFYKEGLMKLLSTVTKEVFLSSLILDSEDLSQIVKASINSERLIIHSSKISISHDLDFYTGANSNIQYLSIQYSDRFKWYGTTWDDLAEKFEQIPIAIKNSALKDSLKTLNIYNCPISTSKIVELLKNYGLSHINVTRELVKPSLS
ncbi:unnamed protein product [Moneuplotes crassus]|uniref:Uncharacterized protein n=1 Tax=Euplotes crassus TaxID=5936 RepID=A0AAD1XZU5_EUPCR|nr:unnamed protein product [Moneuplotes crassus]